MTTVTHPTASPTDAAAADKPSDEVGKYVILEKIGQGSFATVYKGQHKETGHFVAIKSVLRTKLTKKLLENLESEISILKAIRHDHIVGLFECQKTTTHIHLVMDYCSLGDLSQYIKRIRHSKTARGPLGGLPEPTVRHFLKHLVSALQFLRSKNLVHRDIKPQNLLLVTPQHKDDLPQLQVADFGFARFLPNASLADTLCGSPLYMGPEILSYKKYNAKADLWSVGAVLYEMITGRPPFRAQNHIELLRKIQENQDRIRFPDEKGPDAVPLVSDDLKDLIRKLLKQDPVERISFEEFFAHPVLQQPNEPQLPSMGHRHHQQHHHHHRYSLQAHPAHDESPAQPIPLSSSPPMHPLPRATPATTPPTPPTPRQHRYSQIEALAADEPLPFAQPSPMATTAATNMPTRRHAPVDMAHHPSAAAATVGTAYTRHQHHVSADQMAPHSAPVHSSPTRARFAREGGRTQEEVEDVLHEYVVLDRRTIETNQFADEINIGPHGHVTVPGATEDDKVATVDEKQVAVAIPRRKSSGSSSSEQGYLPSSTSPGTPPFMISRERRLSAGTAGTALAKALSMASVRLFGNGHSPPNPNYLTQQQLQQQQQLQHQQQQQQQQQHRRLSQGLAGSPRTFMLTAAAADDDELDASDEKTMALIERAACMGHAVGKFADSKFDMLIQGNSSNRQSLQHGHHNDHYNSGSAPLGLIHESILAAEALVLHVKALALLEDGLKIAKKYWQQRQLDTRAPRIVSLRLNDAVQWMRERFNECLDRASFEKSRCDQDEHDTLPYHNACVEKLLYDRALELCRAAAVHELVGENVAECEQDYRTAIWMLEAILEVGDDKDINIEDDDRRIINKFIDSIQQRIAVLRKR